MAVLGKNECTPQRIYGPMSHTIFMGCSVKSFSVSAGWNEQASNLTVEIVQDPCVSEKIYWDESLNRQTGVIADPGFPRCDPGVPVYFRIEERPGSGDPGGFEYCGLVQSWTESFDANGNPQYTVQVTDPRIVLENTQVIVNNFVGTTSGVFNLMNAYGYVESLGAPCASSPAGAIGGTTYANSLGLIANERGMLWNDVKCAIHTLTASVNQALSENYYAGYLRETRIVYVGATPAQEGYGVIKSEGQLEASEFGSIPNANLYANTYLVDLTEIPFAPHYYRISGPNISLMEIISQVCQDAGCDYYMELLPVKNAGQVVKIIKVRIAVRTSQPQLGRLDEFITTKQEESENANGGVLRYSKGEEVRNEDTSIFLMGGENRDPYEVTNANMLPYWGLDIDGNLIQATVVGGEYRVRLDVRRLNTTLYTPIASSFAWVSEAELRAILGDMDTWKHVALLQGLDIAAHLVTIKQAKFIDNTRIEKVAKGNLPAAALFIPNFQATSDEIDPKSPSAKDLTSIYDFIKSFADEFYGKKFIAAAPFICWALDPVSGKYRYSHEPSTEGCWVTDDTSTVIGLAHQTAASDFFRAEDGKYQAIVRYPIAGFTFAGGAGLISDPSQLGDDNYITNNASYIWAKAELDGKVFFGNPSAPSNGVPGIVVTVGAPVVNRTSDDDTGTEGVDQPQGGANWMGQFDGGDGLDVPLLYIDRSALSMAMLGNAVSPDAALIPVWNHVQVYGPWGVVGLPGQVRLETDDGMVPWEFGSDNMMYAAALDKVSTAVTQMRKGERGSITLAGYPNIPLGAELFSVDTNNPPVSQGTQKYVETRTMSISQCAPIIPYNYCGMNKWTGEFGPNVTNVNVQVGPGGFTTEYQFSTYTPRFGRFNKDNAERLKRIGQQRLGNARNARAKQALSRQIAAAAARIRQRVETQIGKTARAPKSASHMFLGRFAGESKRNEGFTINAKEATLTFPTDEAYAKTALMSMDGLFRPISKDGDGDLPPFVDYTDDSCSGTVGRSVAPDGPYNEYQNLIITQTYLDPVANPNDDLLTDYSDVPATGHDIEVLGRGSSPPPSGWAIAEGEEAGEGGYADDYRFLALRGPMMLQAWGYDTDGKPVPNKADNDDDAEDGFFQRTHLEDKFLDAWLKKPKTWPVAPVDLRLDRERGVWTVPPPPRNLIVTTPPCLLDNSTGTVFNFQSVYDAAGNIIASPTVNVEWPWTPVPPANIGKLPVYYDTFDCKYYAFPISRLDAEIKEDCGDGVGLTTDINQIIFNKGFKGTFVDLGCERVLTVEACPSGVSGSGVLVGWIPWTGCFEGYDDCLSEANSFPQIQPPSCSIQVQCIDFGHGLTVETTGTTATVEAWQFLSDVTDYCGESLPVTGECNSYYHLLMGSGLHVEEKSADCRYVIHSQVLATGSKIADECLPTVRSAAIQKNIVEGRLVFEGSLSTEYDTDTCDFRVSGLDWRNWISNTGACDRDPPAAPVWSFEGKGAHFQGLILGTGLEARQATRWVIGEHGAGYDEDIPCFYRIDSTLTVGASGHCGQAKYPATDNRFETLIFSGLRGMDHPDGTECKTLIKHVQNISHDGSCDSSEMSEIPFEHLILSTGLKVVQVDTCEFRIAGGIEIWKEGCGAGSSTKKNTAYLSFGSGINLYTNTEHDCSYQVDTALGRKYSCDIDGQRLNCGTYDTIGLTDTNCLPLGECGPYEFRSIPNVLNGLSSGPGIGFASVSGSCDLIIFANQCHYGLAHSIATETADCETNWNVGQVYRNDYSDDFALSNGATAKGGGFDNFNATQAVKLHLNEEKAVWSCPVVCDIRVTKTTHDGIEFVTEVEFQKAVFGGTVSCNDTYWIKAEPCASCGDGQAWEEAGTVAPPL